MDKNTRYLIRDFAGQQIETLELLIKAIDTAEGLHDQLMSSNSLVSEYSTNLQAAEARIQEDESTIQFKDNQISAIAKENIILKEEVEHLRNKVDNLFAPPEDRSADDKS